MIAAAFYLAATLTRGHCDPDVIRRRKKKLLQRFAQSALARSRFHRDRMAQAGLRPEDLIDPEQLNLLPVMERGDLVERLDDIAVCSRDRDSWRELRTSGSSGVPLQTWITPHEAAVRQALHLRSRILAGRKLWYREAVIGSWASNTGGKPKSSRLGWSTYLPASADPQETLQQLRRFAPDHIVAFPSTLLRFGSDHGLKPKLITTGSEVLEPETREMLQHWFGAPVRDIYGAIETGLLAFQCRAGAGYHLNEDLIHFEFQAVPGAPGTAEVLVTPLYAQAVPLVRYRLGDLVRIESGPCRCGSALAAISAIEGRRDDWLQRPDGREIAPAAVRAIFRGPEHPGAYRVTQVEGDRMILELVLQAGSEHLAQRLGATLSHLAGWTVELVVREALPPDPSGKIRAIRRFARHEFAGMERNL